MDETSTQLEMFPTSQNKIDMEKIFNTLDQIPPTEVLKLLGEPIRKPKRLGEGHYKCLCPFPGHNDFGVGSFDVNDGKGIAKCFACQKGGRPVRLYRDLTCLKSDYEAAVYFAEDLGLITKRDRHRLLRENKKEEFITEMVSPAKIPERKAAVNYEEPPLQPVSCRSAFYQAFIRQIPLLEKDKEYLRTVRQLPERYEKYFFGQPTKQMVKKALPKVFEVLGWDFEDYLGIPGMYVQYGTEENEKARIGGTLDMVYHGNECFGLAIPDINGQIAGLQFRNYKPNADGLRYFMLSSGYLNSSRFPKKGEGRSGLSPIGFLPAQNRKPIKQLALTEGMFKAISLAEHGYNTLFLQGVNSSTELVNTMNEYMEKHPEQERSVVLAFDADLKTKPQVAMAVHKIYESLLEADYHVSFLSWDEQYGKGIDDVCLNGNGSKIRLIKAEPFAAKYLTPQIEAMKEESEKKRQKFLDQR